MQPPMEMNVRQLGYTITRDQKQFISGYDFEKTAQGINATADFSGELSDAVYSQKLKVMNTIKKTIQQIWPNEKFWVIRIFESNGTYFFEGLSDSFPSWLQTIRGDSQLRMVVIRPTTHTIEGA